MEIISFIGIVAALILIILGSVRGYSLILLSTVAALLVAATGPQWKRWQKTPLTA